MEESRQLEEEQGAEYLSLESVLGFERERDSLLYAQKERKIILFKGQYLYSVRLAVDRR